MSRSAYRFCQGLRGAVRISSMPSDWIRSRTSALYLLSRSRMRYWAASRSANASTIVPVFHNGEDIAGVDRLAIGMIGMARHGPDQVSPNQLPTFQARVFGGHACDSGIVH